MLLCFQSHSLVHINDRCGKVLPISPVQLQTAPIQMKNNQCNIMKSRTKSVELSDHQVSKDLLYSIGSPPCAIDSPPCTVKRPGCYSAVDDLPIKKPHIAHIQNKPEEVLYGRNESPALTSATALSSESDRNVRATLKQAQSVIEIPKYIKDYPAIEMFEQNCRYKEDFHSEYEEYRNLHSVVNEVSCKFARLQEKLRRHKMGTAGYNIIKNKIITEYNRNKKNPKYQGIKQRFQYLHDKLSHIKKLVLEFESAHDM